MAALSFVIVLASLATLAACTPADTKPQKNVKTKVAAQPVFTNPANLKYTELEYIYSKYQGSNHVARPKTLTPCARAILGCCKEGQMQEICSVQLGCGAFFFEPNPCSESFVKEALRAAQAFYGQYAAK